MLEEVNKDYCLLESLLSYYINKVTVENNWALMIIATADYATVLSAKFWSVH